MPIQETDYESEVERLRELIETEAQIQTRTGSYPDADAAVADLAQQYVEDHEWMNGSTQPEDLGSIVAFSEAAFEGGVPVEVNGDPSELLRELARVAMALDVAERAEATVQAPSR